LIKKIKKNYKKEDLKLIKKLLIINSWWDSLDTIAKNILCEYLLEHPAETKKVMDRFSNSDNIWLNRSAILFQLTYKEKLILTCCNLNIKNIKIPPNFSSKKPLAGHCENMQKQIPKP